MWYFCANPYCLRCFQGIVMLVVATSPAVLLPALLPTCRSRRPRRECYICPGNQCCSIHGFCGTTRDHCKEALGCNKAWGHCWADQDA